MLTNAEALWRGSAYADVADLVPSLAAEAVRLAELRLLTVETRIRCGLALGEHRRQIAELESLVAANPLRESLYGLLALALYRSDRQADALAAVARARQVLDDELGIDAGPELRSWRSTCSARNRGWPHQAPGRSHRRCLLPSRSSAGIRSCGRLRRSSTRLAVAKVG